MAGENIGEAYVRIRPETSGFRSETTSALSRDLKATEKEIGRFTRGAALGSGALHGLGRGVIYASNTIIGGYGLVYAVRKSTEAAKENQVTQGQLTNAVRSAGIQYGLYRGEIEAAVKATQDLGFTTDDARRSFSTLIRATGDVARATRDQALAANIARATNHSLAQATTAVAQAEAGRAGALQRLVPGLEKTKHAQQSLAEAQRITAGAAERYARSAAGAQQRLNSAISETEVTIGTALLPTITRLSTQLADWLDKSENQKRIQRDVNKVVKDGTQVVHGLANAEKLIAPPIRTAVHALGGLEHAVETALILGLALKARRAAAEMGLIRVASSRARTQIVSDAVVEERALQGVGTQAGRTGRLLGRVGIGGRGAGRGGLAALLIGSSFLPQGGASSNLQGAATFALIGSTFGPEGATAAVAAYEAAQGIKKIGGQPSVLGSRDPLDTRPDASGRVPPVHFNIPGGPSGLSIQAIAAAARRRAGVTVPGSVSGATRTGIGALSPSQRNALALTAASRTATTADDLAALREQRGLLAKAIATESRRLSTAPNAKAAAKYAENLQSLESQDAAAFGQIQSIEEQAAAAARARAAAIKAAAAARLRAEKAAQAAIDRANAERFANLLSNANEQIKQYAAITRRREAIRKAAEREAARAVGGAAKSLLGGIGFAQHGRATTATSFTLAQLYAEAESEFKLYGSNYGPRGTVLSPQQQRASYSNTVIKGRTHVTVVQNFHAPTKASAAMYAAQAAARALN